MKLDGLPEGIEIATLRGDLAKGGGEILLRTPPGYVVPNHSHTSDELYVWLKGPFTYVAADGTRQQMNAPAISVYLETHLMHLSAAANSACSIFVMAVPSISRCIRCLPRNNRVLSRREARRRAWRDETSEEALCP